MTDAGELHVEKRSFARVPSAMIHDARISPGALRCYAHMYWRYGKNETNFEGRRSIATYLSVSEKMVSKYIKELEAYGWIVVVERAKDEKTGQHKTPYYHVFERRKASDIFRTVYTCKDGEKIRAKPTLSDKEKRKLRTGKGGKPTHKPKEQASDDPKPETLVPDYENSSSHAHENSSSTGTQENLSTPAHENLSTRNLDTVKDSYLDAEKELAADAAPKRRKRSKKPTIPAEQINPMKDAIHAAFKYPAWSEMTTNEKGKINAAAKQLCAAGKTPADVPVIYKFCESKYDNFTPLALASHANEALRSKNGSSCSPAHQHIHKAPERLPATNIVSDEEFFAARRKFEAEVFGDTPA